MTLCLSHSLYFSVYLPFSVYHLVFVDVFVDGAKRVANDFNLGSVVRHRHVLLSYVVKLLPELKLARRRVRGENFL